ncbi:MAG TPA: hypothetical protein VK171_17325, partial [Fimbriimonas sp.]|nr:hypothetical protein [Fimbriimonas sp.]
GVAKVLGEHFSKLYSDRPEVVRGYAAERALLDQLVTQTLDAQAALRGVVKLNSSSKRRRGSRPKAVAFAGQKPPSDWVPGQIPPEDPGSSL